MVSEIYFSELDETENQKLYNKFDKKRSKNKTNSKLNIQNLK
jgi:hypothetical protein